MVQYTSETQNRIKVTIEGEKWNTVYIQLSSEKNGL